MLKKSARTYFLSFFRVFFIWQLFATNFYGILFLPSLAIFTFSCHFTPESETYVHVHNCAPHWAPYHISFMLSMNLCVAHPWSIFEGMQSQLSENCIGNCYFIKLIADETQSGDYIHCNLYTCLNVKRVYGY